jgi:hypothetical protein
LGKASQYQNLSEVLHDLKNGSSSLYDKAVSTVTDVRATIAALKPPARKFVDEVKFDLIEFFNVKMGKFKFK